MTGQFEIEIYSSRIHYQLTIRRFITVIQGNSATGKTELVRLVSNYQENGPSSGVVLRCEKECVVLGKDRFWEKRLKDYAGCIVFLDENATFVRSQAFADAIKGTDNYYVLICRDSLYQLPYSIEEIYGIRESQKYKGLKRIYNEIFRLYPSETLRSGSQAVVITEDTNSGFEYFQSVYGAICRSAGGKSRILSTVKACEAESVLAIVDGAAFGAEMARFMRYVQDSGREIILYAPESFEYLILASGIFSVPDEILHETYAFADSCHYFSWEEFYTEYLVRCSEGSVYQYTKRKLNPAYLTAGSRQKIQAAMPAAYLGIAPRE